MCCLNDLIPAGCSDRSQSNIQNGQPELGNQPFYDYKVRVPSLCVLILHRSTKATDDRHRYTTATHTTRRPLLIAILDLLLLPALSHYLLELPQGSGRASEFFSRNATLQNGTYAQILNRWVTIAAIPTFAPYSSNPKDDPLQYCSRDALRTLPDRLQLDRPPPWAVGGQLA